MRHRCNLLLSGLGVAILAAAASAQPIGKAELKQRFEQRYPQVQRLKQSGAVGETYRGLIAGVGAGDATAGDVVQVVEQENRDRAILYRILAEDLRAKLDEPERSLMGPQVVAERNARRNFKRAATDVQLAVAEGIWTTKRDRPWLMRLLAMQDEGLVGETSEGYVARVHDGDDRGVDRVIEQENAMRRDRYEQLARARGVPIDRIARDQAELYIEAAHRSVPVRRPDGTWKPTRSSS